MFIVKQNQENYTCDRLCSSMCGAQLTICVPVAEMHLGEYVTIRPTFGYRSRNDPGD